MADPDPDLKNPDFPDRIWIFVDPDPDREKKFYSDPEIKPGSETLVFSSVAALSLFLSAPAPRI